MQAQMFLITTIVCSIDSCKTADYTILIDRVLSQALGKNGKVFGQGIMVGVQRCMDKVSGCIVSLSLSPLFLYIYTYSTHCPWLKHHMIIISI